MKTFNLEIITQEGVAWSGEAESITLTAADGEIGVMSGHTPLVSVILPGEALVRTPQGMKVFAVMNGFLRVTPAGVTVLSDAADALDALDEKKALEAREKAQKLMSKKLTDREFAEAESSLQRSLLQLKVLHKRRSHHGAEIGQ
ncbi:MAG: ATP synthase F1 subunit epsilon [Candidatus Niyogibacteria bacterium]|nr:ATP synthase F1 subunit epsilon [Candidatus Niyogibacteria bacterium]